MTEIPRRQAARSLIDVRGPLTDEQAARVLAILNRHRYPREQSAQPAQPDAA